MTTIRRFALLVTMIFSLAGLCLADGLSIENGRYDGPAFVMKLTMSQSKEIRDHYEVYKSIKLTKGQRESISKNSNVSPAPTTLCVARAKDIQGDCACGLSNFGLLISEDSVEIPLDYLCTDKEAEDRAITE